MFYSLAIFTCRNDPEDGNGSADDGPFENWQDVFRETVIVEFEDEVPLVQIVKDVESDTDADILMCAAADVLFDKRSVWDVVDRVCAQDPKELHGDFLMLGRQSGGSACYFFRRGMFHDLPPTAVVQDVRVLVKYCLARNIPVIDASIALNIEPLNQNRDDFLSLPVSHVLCNDGIIVAK